MIVTEREVETQAEGEAGYMHREPDVGFDPGPPGSRPGPKQAPNRCAPRDPLFLTSRGPSRLFSTVAAPLFMYSWETPRGRFISEGKWGSMRGAWCGTWTPRTPGSWPETNTCSTTEAPRCLADSISLLVICLFKFLISSFLIFAMLCISRNWSISSRF